MFALFKPEAKNYFYTEEITCLIIEQNGFVFPCYEGES